jgi:outer membrane immunogenic protein
MPACAGMQSWGGFMVAKFMLATALLGASSIANAADIKLKAPAAPVATAYNWTGFYIGANAGYGAGGGSKDTVGGQFIFPGSPPFSSGVTIAPSGFFAGGQAGYNWQTGRTVFGLEADIQKTNSASDTYCGFIACPSLSALTPSSFGTVVQQKLDWFATARARLGWDIGPALVYATGGAAWGSVNTSFTATFNGVPPTAAAASFGDTKIGWVVGAGIEAPIADNLTVKAEYLHMSLSSFTDSFVVPGVPALGGGSQGFSNETKLQDDLIRVGLNLRLGTSAPAPGAPAGGMYLKAARAAPVAYNWTGVYVGGNLGYAAGGQSPATINNTFLTTPSSTNGETTTLPDTGVFGGGQIGANMQFGKWVAGAEVDLQGTAAKAGFCGFLECEPRPPSLALTPGSWLTNIGQQLDWFSTARGRFGVASGRILYYGTGGLAWGRRDTTISETYNGTPPTVATATFHDTTMGYVIGAGMEAVVWDKWTVKFEYLFMNLNSATDILLVPATISSNGVANRFVLQDALHESIFRVGMNYKVY